MKRVIRKEALVPAPLDEVWRAWTTTEGVTAFFAPRADVQLALGGRYELYFTPDGPPGERGTEGCKVMLFDPEKRTLAVTWNAPPHLPLARKERTRVDVRLDADGDATRVVLHHTGFVGPEAEAAYEYFRGAWDVVLSRLVERFETGKAVAW